MKYIQGGRKKEDKPEEPAGMNTSYNERRKEGQRLVLTIDGDQEPCPKSEVDRARI